MDHVIHTPADSEVSVPDGVGWVRTWGASPQAPDDSVSSIDAFENATLRQLVRISGGGQRIRVRLSNEYGTERLVIGAARVALADADGADREGSSRAVLFGGRSTVTVPAGAPVLSDPIDLPVDALARLAVSLYVPGRVDTVTCHGTFHALGLLIPGDATGLGAPPEEAAPLPAQGFLTAVEAWPVTPAGAVVVLGDSRADGIGSTPGTDRRWTDLLAGRLHARGGRTRCVINQGIGGNRLLSDGVGTAALARFDRDVLATPGLGHVVVAVGNDLVFSFAPCTGETAGFLAMFPGRARGRGRHHRRPPPSGGTGPRPRSEGPRRDHRPLRRLRDVLARRRQGARAGQRVDPHERRLRRGARLRAVWRDPADPTRIRAGLHMGDHLHGNDAGYAALAESVDPSLFD
ncbi:SGNH/GDSL hydrolase family protein [Streptomyces sp. NBC_01789]|uniref:SGNH/GDSL hydrolase family protein n=1 Tax=Streptomyces sp. NBC_01789 TaxID=2975941 RepID=UPI002255737B|nr:SGNH/GDSL hydrolase family protein [Streptomyces sp. NBC_01789]MCX4451116.1 SGNH/GDSL hydrolase family protein [Streptomyces sp. NBC_01789]